MVKVNKLMLTNSELPDMLRHIPHPPAQLYVRGSLELLQATPKLAVVGTRKVTPYGRGVTEKLVREVTGVGVTIVSGLALGVDGIAHQSCLEAGGRTIAVMPCGLDKIYPATHQRLAEKILENNGTLISEYEPGTPPLRQHFVARNRLVSGLSDAVLITEAARKSGTLHTANFALEQGRTVLAVPGNITSPSSAGTNSLLSAGAVVALESNDILRELNVNIEQANMQLPLGDTPEETTIIQLISEGISEGKVLLEKSGADTHVFSQTMTMLELSGTIKPLGADHWSLS
ncbi:hypothetical protein BH23PAT2_BH23PAT2_05010 [soil metagenome]